MDVKEAVKLVSEITPANGFVYTPSDVGSEPTRKLRGVQVTDGSGGKVSVKVNAEGEALEQIKKNIREKLGDAVAFVGDPEPPKKKGADDDTSKKAVNASRKD